MCKQLSHSTAQWSRFDREIFRSEVSTLTIWPPNHTNEGVDTVKRPH